MSSNKTNNVYIKLPSVLWHRWFGRQEEHPASKKNGGMVEVGTG